MPYTYVIRFINSGHYNYIVYYTDKQFDEVSQQPFFRQLVDIRLMDTYPMDYDNSKMIYNKYCDMRYQETRAGRIQHRQDIVELKPIIPKMDDVNKYIDEYNTIANSTDMEIILRDITMMHKQFFHHSGMIKTLKRLYDISFDSKGNIIDIMKMERLEKECKFIMKCDRMRQDNEYIQHSDEKLQHLEAIRYYKYNVKQLKELLNSHKIDCDTNNIMDIDRVDNFLKSVIETLYANIIKN